MAPSLSGDTKDCEKFVVKPEELETLFEKLESDLVPKENTKDYKLMIRNLLYTIFANPGPIVRSKIDEEICFYKLKSLVEGAAIASKII